MKLNELQTKTSKIYKRKDGIFVKEFFDNAQETIDTVKDDFFALEKLSDGKKCLLLVKTKGLVETSTDARNYITHSEEAKRLIKKNAVIIENISAETIFSFLEGYNKPNYPMKAFKSIDEAIAWLKEESV